MYSIFQKENRFEFIALDYFFKKNLINVKILNMRCMRTSSNHSGSIFTDLGLIWLIVGVYPWLLSIP